MRRLFAYAAGFAFLALPLSAAEVTTHTLENGMEIVVLEDTRAPVVVHMVWYRVGSADEPAGTSGIAHFLEHLMFKATDTLESGELSQTVAANGGSDNAFTSYDFTAYFQRVAADRLELMMEMESSRMDGLRLVPEDIPTERGVVVQERKQRTDNSPGALFGEQRRAAQFLNHRYGVPIIGWMHEAERLSMEDAMAFYDRHYGPNNAILVVAGDADPDEVIAMAERHYGVIPANPNIVPRERVAEPPQLAERRLVMEDARVAQPYVIRTYLAPERDAGDQREAAALTLLAEVLGGTGATSVLGTKLEFDRQVSIYTSAFYSGLSLDDTTFGLVIVPAEGVSLEEAEAALDGAVAEFFDEGVDPDQLDRIKMQLRAAQIYEADNISSLARRYGAALTSGLTVADVEAWPDILQDISAEEIVAAGRAVFNRNNAVTGWLRAPETGPELEATQ
ncbi:MAG: pitrilysin family protein [Paracoccaceae bacterium]|nr:pitrilysin family protein [Paracoccaceae bacterium]